MSKAAIESLKRKVPRGEAKDLDVKLLICFIATCTSKGLAPHGLCRPWHLRAPTCSRESAGTISRQVTRGRKWPGSPLLTPGCPLSDTQQRWQENGRQRERPRAQAPGEGGEAGQKCHPQAWGSIPAPSWWSTRSPPGGSCGAAGEGQGSGALLPSRTPSGHCGPGSGCRTRASSRGR